MFTHNDTETFIQGPRRGRGWGGGICNNAEWSLLYEGSLLNLKTTPRNYGFLKQIISADGIVSDAFR